VRGEAVTLEPVPAPDLRQQRNELAEVRRTFDRAGTEPQLFRHVVIVDGAMAAVLLIGQHLFRFAQRAAQVKRRIKAHVLSPQPLTRPVRRRRMMPCASAMMRSMSSCT